MHNSICYSYLVGSCHTQRSLVTKWKSFKVRIIYCSSFLFQIHGATTTNSVSSKTKALNATLEEFNAGYI